MKKNSWLLGQICYYCNCSTCCGSNWLTPLLTASNPGQSCTGHVHSVRSEWHWSQTPAYQKMLALRQSGALHSVSIPPEKGSIWLMSWSRALFLGYQRECKPQQDLVIMGACVHHCTGAIFVNCDLIGQSIHGTPLRGPTILPSSIAMGYCTVYRSSYSGTRQTQFCAMYLLEICMYADN